MPASARRGAALAGIAPRGGSTADPAILDDAAFARRPRGAVARTRRTDVDVLVNQIVYEEPLISDSRKGTVRKLVYSAWWRAAVRAGGV